MGRTPPNLPKDPLLVTKWVKNGMFDFVRRLRGVRFKKSRKVTIWGVPNHSTPKSILAPGEMFFTACKPERSHQDSHLDRHIKTHYKKETIPM